MVLQEIESQEFQAGILDLECYDDVPEDDMIIWINVEFCIWKK